MKRIMRSGCHATMAAQASSTRFLAKVCPLVSFSASPKQPQSSMGLATKSQSVTSVITTMKTSVSRDAKRRWIAKSRKIPRQNSKAESPTDEASVSQSGTHAETPTAPA